jgi:hypothetical protein
MEDILVDSSNLLKECQTIAENCLYNAQAHYILADTKERRVRCWLIVPSAIAGVAGLLTALSLPAWIGAFSALGGVIVTIAAILGVDKEPGASRNAASQWTALRHEARSLHETYFKELPREQFLAEVRRIDDRYNALIQALPPTDHKSFELARKQIKAGTHQLDFRETGSQVNCQQC